MAVYTDREVQDFDEWIEFVECSYCGKPYKQCCEEQAPGLRKREYDICPYCGHENGSSMTEKYINSELPDAEIEDYYLLGIG